MVLTRAQLDSLSKEELVEEFLKFSNITDQLQSLTKQFDDFIEKYNIFHSELLVSKNCNSLLLNCIVNLDSNALNNAQYIRSEVLEINPVPQSISNDELEQSVCHVLSLTGTTVKPDDIHVCHRMNKVKVIIKFKNRKQRNEVMFKRKELKSKTAELRALQFGQSLFINDSMCFENQVLFYKCRKLKNLGRLSAVWFFNNTLSVKIEENSPISKIYHVSDLEKLLKVDNIEELINVLPS